jgi:DNA-binding NtrC family response regulator
VPWEVLVVDDDEGVRELILSYFNGLGMTATGADDGRTAIAMLQKSNGRCGLVLTDLNMPGADGFAVLQAARQANPACYVVIVTGYASLDSAILAVRVGAYDYLTKPFSLGQLDVILSRIADRERMQGQRTLDESREPSAAPPAEPDIVVEAVPVDSVEQRLARLEQLMGRIASRVDLLVAR